MEERHERSKEAKQKGERRSFLGEDQEQRSVVKGDAAILAKRDGRTVGKTWAEEWSEHKGTNGRHQNKATREGGRGFSVGKLVKKKKRDLEAQRTRNEWQFNGVWARKRGRTNSKQGGGEKSGGGGGGGGQQGIGRRESNERP